MSDLLSRQDVIGVIDNAERIYVNNLPTMIYKHSLEQAIMAIPTQPEPEITDEQAIEHLQSSGWMQNHDKQMYEMGAKEQPQRIGHWVNGRRCSICGDFWDDYISGDIWYDGDPQFCPHCGAKMEENNEDR